MGLDNGIIMRSKKHIEVPRELERASESICSAYSDGYTFEYDLCYWRKCWNIRYAIATSLDTVADLSVGKSDLTIQDIKNIWYDINYLNHKRVWDEGDSIWTYKEIRDNLDSALLTFEWLIYFMRKHEKEFKNGDICVEFYDSY